MTMTGTETRRPMAGAASSTPASAADQPMGREEHPDRRRRRAVLLGPDDEHDVQAAPDERRGRDGQGAGAGER